MAKLNYLGNITARCAGCNGSLSTYEWAAGKTGDFGAIFDLEEARLAFRAFNVQYRLYRCAGCGCGGLAELFYHSGDFPAGAKLQSFFSEVTETLPLPKAVPKGIVNEFREAERCQANSCFRAAASLFRSVLDKTLRANGYKLKPGTTLAQQIDLAADDGVLTEARRRRAHDEVRVLGNDVLHEEWKEILSEDVDAAHKYVQRILEDFYDSRESTLQVLRDKMREPDEDRQTVAKNDR